MIIFDPSSDLPMTKSDMMSYEDWFDRYDPIVDPDTDDYCYEDGEVIETYLEKSPHQVWFLCEIGEDAFIVPSTNTIFSPLSYFVTKVHFDPAEDTYVSYDCIEDDECAIKSLIEDFSSAKERAVQDVGCQDQADEIEEQIEYLIERFEENWRRPYAPVEELKKLGLFSEDA